jgi:hypothetical protein
MPVYYEIKPNTHYLVPEVNISNNAERIELFYKAKKTNENLYIGSIDSSRLSKYDFSKDIIKYFREREFLNTLHRSIDYQPSDYQFPKCCWLADDILKNKLKYPLSVHYNPRLQKNVVHPGQTRSYIAQLFQPDEIPCLYFNTSGVKYSWMRNLSIVEKEELNNINFLNFMLGADHGSLIPHIYFSEQSSNLDEIFKYHIFLKNRLSDMRFRIKSNVLIHPLEYWTVDTQQAHIEIDIKDTKSNDDVVRACILSVLGVPYQSNTLTVKVNPL